MAGLLQRHGDEASGSEGGRGEGGASAAAARVAAAVLAAPWVIRCRDAREFSCGQLDRSTINAVMSQAEAAGWAADLVLDDMGVPGARRPAFVSAISAPDGSRLGHLVVFGELAADTVSPQQRTLAEDLATHILPGLLTERRETAPAPESQHGAVHDAVTAAALEPQAFQDAVIHTMRAARSALDARAAIFVRLSSAGDRLLAIGGEAAAEAGGASLVDHLRSVLDANAPHPTVLRSLASAQPQIVDISPVDTDAVVRIMAKAGARGFCAPSIRVGCETFAAIIALGETRPSRSLLETLGRALPTLVARLRDADRAELFRRVVEASNDVVLITEAEPIEEPGPRIVYANPAFERQTGYSTDEVLGKTPRILQGPDTSALARENIRTALVAWEPVRQEILNYRADGTCFWVELNIAPVADATGWYTHWVSVQRDITRQKNEANRLADSELSFRTLFERHPAPMWLYDTETLQFLEVNGAACALYGWTREEFLAMTILDIRPEEDREEVLRRARSRSPVSERTTSGPWRHVTARGDTRRVMIHARSLEFAGRKAVLVLAWDVTERMLAESEARELSARLTATFESISDGLFSLDRQWRFTYVNGQAERLLQRSAADLVGNVVWDEFPDAVGTELHRRFFDVARTRQTARFEFFYPPIDTWFEVSAFPAPEGLTVYFRDITDRKRQAALVEWQATMLAHAKDAIVVRSLDGRVLFWNAMAERLYGWKAAEVDGKPIEQLLYDSPEPIREATARVVQQGRWSGRLAQRRRDGSRIVVQASWSLIPGSGSREPSILSISSDLSDVIALEEQLNQASRLDAVGQLTGGIAHDFNNLLTVILGNAEMLTELLPEDSEANGLALMTLKAAERGAELTSRLLAFARKQPLDPKPTDINRLVAGVEPLIARTIGENIEIEFARAGGLWAARVDASQLESALLNLCLNARDAMAPAGGKLTIETANTHLDDDYAAHHADVTAGQYVMLAVTDTGCGMAPDVMTRVFEPFFTTKAPGSGSGLGMSMVFGFVKQSGGHVKLYSEPGEGTTVRIYLPRAFERADEQPGGSTGLAVGMGETILVVEDDDLVRHQAETYLRALGYNVLAAANGGVALELLRARTDIKLLFTDVVMSGGMSGRQLADAALALRPSLPVLFTTGYTENSIVHQGRLDPGVHLLPKPYRRSDLAAKIGQLLKVP